MEFLLEFILELIIEGSIYGSQNKKLPWPVRIFLGLVVATFFLSLTIGLVILGLIITAKNEAGILIVILGLSILLMSIRKLCDIYVKKS